MKRLLGVMRRLTCAAAVWAFAGVAMADDCTNPPLALQVSRHAGSGIGGYEVTVQRLDGAPPWAFWTAQPKNPANPAYAPFWARNCPFPAGMGTQVLKFTLYTNNYFSSGISGGPAHMPVFLMYHSNNGSPDWNFRGAGLALFPYTGGGMFSGVMFEDWDLPNANKNYSALPNFQFQDGVLYNIQVNVTNGATAVWVWDSAWNLLANTGTNIYAYTPPATGPRSMDGGYGFSVLCNVPDVGGCEYDSGPLQHVTFDVNFGSIQVAYVP